MERSVGLTHVRTVGVGVLLGAAAVHGCRDRGPASLVDSAAAGLADTAALTARARVALGAKLAEPYTVVRTGWHGRQYEVLFVRSRQERTMVVTEHVIVYLGPGAATTVYDMPQL